MKYSHKKKFWLLKWEGTLPIAEAFLLLPSRGEKKYYGDTWDLLPNGVENRVGLQGIDKK